MERRAGAVLSHVRVEPPWWSGLALGAALYALLKWIVPPIVVILSPALSPAAAAVGASAALVALLSVACFLLWMLHEHRKRRILDRQMSLAALRALPRERFERFLAEAFRREGYVVSQSEHCERAADLMLTRGNENIIVQYRRWRGDLDDATPLRELYAAMRAAGSSGCAMAITGEYGSDVIAFAAGKPVRLIAGPELERMLRGLDAPPGRLSHVRA